MTREEWLKQADATETRLAELIEGGEEGSYLDYLFAKAQAERFIADLMDDGTNGNCACGLPERACTYPECLK